MARHAVGPWTGVSSNSRSDGGAEEERSRRLVPEEGSCWRGVRWRGALNVLDSAEFFSSEGSMMREERTEERREERTEERREERTEERREERTEERREKGPRV